MGFTDPDLVDVPRDSPTLAVRTRYIMFAIAAWVEDSVEGSKTKMRELRTAEKSS